MNTQFGMCPQCKSDIPQERLNESPTVCPHCGWTKAHNHVADQLIFKTYLKVTLTLCFVAAVSFMQVMKWDHYAVSVIPHQIKIGLGFADVSNYKKMSEICTDRKNWDCVESTLAELSRKYPDQLEAQAQLGDIQYKRGKFQEAVQTLGHYLQNGGLSLDASYTYARALAVSGHVEQATQMYERVINAKPETLQVTVVSNYIKMLMDNARNKEAFGVIDSIRKNGGTASLFMDKEYNDLKTKVQ